nr:MAG TPA: hypothetical protein [Caudoviricetes sp.]
MRVFGFSADISSISQSRFNGSAMRRAISHFIQLPIITKVRQF